MAPRYLIAPAVALLLCTTPATANAQVFKCKNADGSTTYSQTPCDSNTKPQTITNLPKQQVSDDVCFFAGKFAVKVAERMRSGMDPAVEIAAHGGVDSIAGGTMAMINYVYTFKSSEDVGTARIESLTNTKCRNGGFGELKLTDIPWPPGIDEGEGDALPEAFAGEDFPAAPGLDAEVPPAVPVLADSKDDKREDVRCDGYRRRIKQVDERMREGYDAEEGERLKAKKRRYQAFLDEFCK